MQEYSSCQHTDTTHVLCVLPGRTGETFGKGTPGANDTGAVDVSAATQKASGALCLLHPQPSSWFLVKIPNRLKRASSHTHLPVAGMQAEEGAAQASSLLDKIKEALPFGTLPVFDLAELSKDDADMGPNEVTKEYLGTGFQNSDNPFDTAMPGLPANNLAAALGRSHPPQCSNATGSQMHLCGREVVWLLPQAGQARPLEQTSLDRTTQARWILAQQQIR